PIIILSGALEKDTAIHALESGAVEVMTKPSGTISIDLYKIREALIKKVKIATLVNVNRITGETGPIFPTTSIPKNTALNTPWTLAIGASTGGPRALNIILSNLPARLPAHVLIVQHMPSTFTASFAQRLDKHSPLHVVEAQHGQTITPGAAYVAPGGIHMLISENNKQPVITLQDSPPINSVCPSVDVLMNSVAQWAGSRSLGVLLTGMGSDGAEGLAQIQATGGYTIAQDKATSTIFGMPRAAIKRKVVNEVLPLKAIPQAIVKIILEGKDHD
ncbi:MAG: chemotaxis protein CheB, partial [Chloroflexota bacterium]|nr:chemotaxis protein CheB [Chloroflexota bacterium]